MRVRSAGLAPADGSVARYQADDNPLAAYRDRTIALLRRYMRMSLEVGRLPSLLGREFFRTRVTSYRVVGFEDCVIFCHDVERCLEKLRPIEKDLIAKIILQDYDYFEVARMHHCTWRTVANRFPAAVDAASEIFLKVKLLRDFSCQEGKNVKTGGSSCEQSK